MASIEKQVLGGISAYTSCGFTASDFNSKATGTVIVATSTVTNATNLDLQARISGTVTVGGTISVSSTWFVLLLEQNRDGTTYGGGLATGGTNPPAHLNATQFFFLNGTTSGNAVTFESPWFDLPHGVFKFGILQAMGISLHATAAVTCEYITRNRNLNG